MTFREKAKGFAARLKLGSHHAIERFGIMVGVLGTVGVLLLAGATTTALTNDRAKLDSTVLYTSSFTTSKTQLSGKVPGVYVSTDRTRALVLMQFKDATAASANAKNYQAFLTGTTMDLSQQGLKTQITGEIVTFGSTGYMGVVLNSAEPFEQQILNLVVRANSELVYTPEQSRKVREDLQGDNSFAKYDQWQVLLNPGASGAEVSTALDASTFDPGSFYAQTVIAPLEQEQRTKMNDQLGVLRASIATIEEYTSQIEGDENNNVIAITADGVRLIMPDAPVQIAGDEVVGEPGETPAGADLTEAEIAAGVVDSSTEELVAEWTDPRGFDFDWRSGSVEEGYLADIVPEGVSYANFLADKRKAKAGSEGEGTSLGLNDIAWTLTDGSDLASYSSTDTSMRPLITVKNGLSQAWQTYYTEKSNYQVKMYNELIDLEIDLRNVESSSTINSGENALITY